MTPGTRLGAYEVVAQSPLLDSTTANVWLIRPMAAPCER
jgi:hypothetical protein